MRNYPIHLEIETTNCCQLRCGFCPNRLQLRQRGFMGWSTLRTIIKQSKGRAKTCYMHQIGEPLLHPDIAEMVHYVHLAGIRTSLSTNALRLTSTMCEELLNAGLDELTLALDSLDKNTYERLRSGARFHDVIFNIDGALHYFNTAMKLGKFIPRVELQVIVTRDNVNEIDRIRDKYETLLENIGILRIKGFSTFAGRVSDMSPEPTKPLRFKCRKLWTSLAINWNGDISLCCRDYDSFQVIGNVHKDRIEAVWNGRLMQELRQWHEEGNFDAHPTLNFCKEC